MAAATGFSAYRAIFGKPGKPSYTPPAARPEGQLVWAHATSPDRLTALRDIAQRLKQGRGKLHVLVTVDDPPTETLPQAEDGADWVLPLGPDDPGHHRAFLDHWAPDLAVWTGGQVLPGWFEAVTRRGIPLLLTDADETGLAAVRGSWFPGFAHRPLRGIDRVMVTTTVAAELAERLGAAGDRIEVAGRLHSAGTPLPISDRAWTEASAMVGTRPIWLAAHAQTGELDSILRAQRQVVRLAHRMLLVLAPSETVPAQDIQAAIERAGLRCADWDEGGSADENTQVLLSTDPRSLGIWFRIAPLTFMGSSLVAGHGGRTPFHAAALGSAVLYGPNIRDHLSAYTRLAAAGAARIVNDGQSLGEAVIRLAAPNQAASMALAGWEVVSEGAHVTDRVLEHMHDLLDSPPGAK